MPDRDECQCSCLACQDAECISGCLNDQCSDPLCCDEDCHARAAEAKSDGGEGAVFVA